MNFEILKAPKRGNSLLVVFLYKDISSTDNPEKPPLSAQFNSGQSDDFLRRLFKSGEISGKKGNQTLIHTMMIDDFSYRSLHLDNLVKPERILFYGLGDPDKVSSTLIRDSFASISKKVVNLKLTSFSVITETIQTVSSEDAVRSAAEGTMLGSYRFSEFKTEGIEETKLENVEFLVNDSQDVSKLESQLFSTKVSCVASLKARDLVNRPPNLVNPEYLKNFSTDLVNQSNNLSIEILDKPELEKLQMRAFLGVAQGSTADPFGIVINYEGDPENNNNNIWLIGKGITFDSGGLSLKPPMAMTTMKSDMSGGAAVITAMEAISALGPKINVTGLCLATENMPDGGAQRVGDIVESMSGRTIEIENTDAEGRLTLADGVEFAKQRGAQKIIDVATLTGAMVISLGHGLIGAFSNNPPLLEAVVKAGEVTGEKIWRMPLDETSKKQNRSKVADIKNTGGRAAGSVTAAHFIGEFVGNTPWVHLDIAGTAMNDSGGATGFPCRTLIQVVLDLS
ncbi:MAG: leucyl aminopeptidase [Chloroflexota bacterium]